MPASTPLELRDRALFELAYSAGLRAEELVNLDVASLDPDAEELRVEGKGGKTRIVPAGEPAWRAIEAYLDARAARAARDDPPEPALFLSQDRAAGSPRRTSGGGCGSRSGAPRCRPGCPRTRCATRSPPTCWRAGPICARSRSCSGTRPSARLRPTLG